MKKIKAFSLAVILLAAVILNVPYAHAAGAATLNVTFNRSSVDAGSTVRLTLTENSGSDSINVVEARLTYDASKLQFINVESSPVFSDATTPNGNSVVRYVPGGASVAGSQTVAIINFRALTGSGSSSVSVVSGSHVYRSADNADIWNGSLSSVSVALTTPAPASNPASKPQSSNPVLMKTTPKQTLNSPVKSDKSATTAPETVTTDPKKDESKGIVKGDADKKNESSQNKDEAKPASNNTGLWLGLLAVIAAVPAYLAGRKYAAYRSGIAAKEAANVAAVAAAAKARDNDKAKNKKTANKNAAPKSKKQAKKSKK